MKSSGSSVPTRTVIDLEPRLKASISEGPKWQATIAYSRALSGAPKMDVEAVEGALGGAGVLVVAGM